MDNVLFLDIDGVLNSEKYFIERGKSKETFLEKDLDKEKIKMLNYIIQQTNCIIVLSSNWRIFGLEKVNEALTAKGLEYTIQYRTTTEDMDRGIQIKKFIDEHDIKNYVILDDDSFDIVKHVVPERFIKTTWKLGLDQNHVNKVIKILSNK